MEEFRQAYQALQRSMSDKPNVPAATAQFRKFQVLFIKNYRSLQKLEDQVMAMDGLELGAILALEKKNIDEFDRIVGQVRQFYQVHTLRHKAKKRQYLIGLYLMWLLTRNKFGEFHTEVELLSADDLNHEYIVFPMRIETFLMEGSYNKILRNCKPPDHKFALFLNELESTVREHISQALQVCHNWLPIKDACGMLKLETPQALRAFVDAQKLNWHVEAQRVVFSKAASKDQDIEASVVVHDLLEFTGSIETIV
jgi:26S proteasome regulatory subunit N12